MNCLSSPAICDESPTGSKRDIAVIPDFLFIKLSHVERMLLANGVTAPIPVMTTRRIEDYISTRTGYG